MANGYFKLSDLVGTANEKANEKAVNVTPLTFKCSASGA